MITHYYKKLHKGELEKDTTHATSTWTHVVAPSDEELAELVERFSLDDAIIRDVRDVFEVPRFEQDGGIAYFFTRYPYDVQDIDIDTAPILFILGESFLITVAQQEVPFLNPFFDGKRDFSTTHRTALFFALLAELMVTYERKLTDMRRLVYKDMGRIRSIKGRDIQRFVFWEQELNEMISALVPTNTWLSQLAKGNYIQIVTDDRELLEDLLIANAQLVDSAKSILKTIQNIRNASEATLAQALNSTIKRLTALTIILTIPTLIASLFGMNVPVPFADNPFGFWIVIGGVVIVVVLTIKYFDDNRWI